VVTIDPTRANHLEESSGRAVATLSHFLHQFNMQSEVRALFLLAELEQ
jgi:hypothetical protein